jgi:dihydrodipicolinate synthase/N-acetylneuraminate lyase
LLQRFGNQPQFSIFIGVGSFMVAGMKRGAAGIVPSVGNLIPDVCQKFYESARRGGWDDAEYHFARMQAVTEIYQKGRTISESLAILKAAMACRDLCEPHILPPLRALSQAECETLRKQMATLHLLKST